MGLQRKGLHPLRMCFYWLFTNSSSLLCDQAARAGYDCNHRQQALHLLEAEEWSHAHSIIIDHLAADDIISGTYIHVCGYYTCEIKHTLNLYKSFGRGKRVVREHAWCN